MRLYRSGVPSCSPKSSVRCLRGLLVGSDGCSSDGGDGVLDGLDGRLRFPVEGVPLRYSAPTIILTIESHSARFSLDLTPPFIDLACLP